MTLIEVYTHFDGTWGDLYNKAGFSRAAYFQWLKRGSIPFKTQKRLEEVTKGALVARLEDDIKKIPRMIALKKSREAQLKCLEKETT